MKSLFVGATCSVLLCLGSLPVSAAPAGGEDWRFRDIQELIQQREASGQPFQSPEELIGALPAGAKQWFTFVYQTNTKFQDASPLYPRALVFNKHFVYAFNGHPSQRGYNTIELMELDEANRKIELREIEFVKDRNGAVRVNAPARTPEKCLQCHTASPRPIWHQYSNWEGVYGSSDDMLDEHEQANFNAFGASLKANPQSRYNRLTLPAGLTDGDYQSRDTTRKRINLAFTKVLARFDATRSLGLAQQSPYYDRLKWILPVVTGQHYCDDNTRAYASLESQLAAIIKARGVPDPGNTLARLMTVLDLPTARFSPETGKQNSLYGDGSTDLMTLFSDLVLLDLAKTDPELASTLHVNTTFYQSDWPMFPLYQWIDESYGRVTVKDCHYLQSQAEKAEQVPLPVPAPVAPSQTFEGQLERAEEVRANPAIPIACVYCHTVQQSDAPHIAFDDETALRGELAAESGRLRERLITRANPSATDGTIMPPAKATLFNKLSDSEYQGFVAYLKELDGG